MADEKVNMGPEENKTPENQSPPGQGDLPPLEENNAPAVSGEDKAAPDHVKPDPPSADKHTQQTVCLLYTSSCKRFFASLPKVARSDGIISMS